jgi:hypothetical protein
MRRLAILSTVTVAAGISAFVLSTHLPSIHASVSELPAQPPASQPKVEPQTDDWSDVPNFAVAADRAISELHEGITVHEWTAHHPGATKIDPASIGIGGECVILAEKATLANGAQVARLVSFNPPHAPSPAIPPSLQGQSLINETCTMSMVQVEVKVSDEAAGRSVQRTVKQRFDFTYGRSQDQSGVWHSGPIEIINAYDSQHRLAFDTGKPKFGPAAYVWAYLPFWKQLMFPDAQISDDPEAESAQFRRALAIAGVDPAISNRMENLYDLEADLKKSPNRIGDDWRKPLVPLLQDWLSALKPVGPDRQAAGLLAADRLLAVFGNIREGGLSVGDGQFGRPDSSSPAQAELRSKLQDLGAVIGQNETDDNLYDYTGNWLEQARHLSPGTEAGKLASFIWMTTAQCQTPEAIISAGEDLISKDPDAHIAAQVHFMVGDAYSDLILRTHGASGNRGKAESARSKALKHYAAGLANDGTSRQARDAWLQAWHISAGLLPHARYDGCEEGD